MLNWDYLFFHKGKILVYLSAMLLPLQFKHSYNHERYTANSRVNFRG